MIRKAELWDAERITELWGKMMEEIEGGDWTANESFFVSCIYKIKNADYLTLVVEEDDYIIGFLQGYITNVEYKTELKGFCDNLYIEPEYRKKGIAHALVEESTEWGYRRGVSTIDFITVYDDRVIKAWKRKGFIPYKVIYRREV